MTFFSSLVMPRDAVPAITASAIVIPPAQIIDCAKPLCVSLPGHKAVSSAFKMPEKQGCKYGFFGITTKDSYISNHTETVSAVRDWLTLQLFPLRARSEKEKTMRGFGQTRFDQVVAGLARDNARLFSTKTAKKTTKQV